MANTIIIIAAALFLGLLIYFFGPDTRIWRYYYRSATKKPQDLKNTHPYFIPFRNYISGIYWNENKSDPRETAAFVPANIKNLSGLNYTLQLTNQPHTEHPQPGEHWQGGSYRYSGAMMYGSQDFPVQGLKVSCTIELPHRRNVKTALWLKNIKKDINEIDIFEVFNQRILNVFGLKFIRITFTAFEGSNYKSHSRRFSTSLWYRAGKKFKISFEESGGMMHWYLNGYLVKMHPSTGVEGPVRFIANICARGRVKFNEDQPHEFKIKFI